MKYAIITRKHLKKFASFTKRLLLISIRAFIEEMILWCYLFNQNNQKFTLILIRILTNFSEYLNIRILCPYDLSVLLSIFDVAPNVEVDPKSHYAAFKATGKEGEDFVHVAVGLKTNYPALSKAYTGNENQEIAWSIINAMHGEMNAISQAQKLETDFTKKVELFESQNAKIAELIKNLDPLALEEQIKIFIYFKTYNTVPPAFQHPPIKYQPPTSNPVEIPSAQVEIPSAQVEMRSTPAESLWNSWTWFDICEVIFRIITGL